MVSVIIPTYNRENTIIRAIRSVLDQTFGDLECIVVDDCSTDSTEKVISQLSDPRLKYIKMNKHEGACVARNVGIDNSKGEFIAFQDSDDEWTHDKIEKQMKVMDGYDVDVCFCEKALHTIGKKEKIIIRPSGLEEGEVPHTRLVHSSLVSTQEIICKREVAMNVRFDPNVIKSQDHDWIMRAGMDYRVFFLKEVLVNQYHQKDSISTGKNKKKITLDMLKYFYNKYEQEFEERKYWQIALLDQIAYYKGTLGMRNVNEYQNLWRMTKKRKYLIKILLAYMGILTVIQKIEYKYT